MKVLNFDRLKESLAARSPHVDIECVELGGIVRLRRLNASVGLALGRQYAAVPKGPDGQPRSEEDMIEFYVLLLVNSMVDEGGKLFLLSEEGKAHVRSLSLGTLTHLGTEALILNDMAERQKKGGTSETPTTY